jgi:hypothetical protein
MAVSADIDVRALPSIEVLCLILHARGVGDSSVVSMVVHTGRVASIAGATGNAVDHSLGIKVDWGWILVFQ